MNMGPGCRAAACRHFDNSRSVGGGGVAVRMPGPGLGPSLGAGPVPAGGFAGFLRGLRDLSGFLSPPNSFDSQLRGPDAHEHSLSSGSPDGTERGPRRRDRHGPFCRPTEGVWGGHGHGIRAGACSTAIIRVSPRGFRPEQSGWAGAMGTNERTTAMIPSPSILERDAGEWKQRMRFIVEMMREISRQTDPQAMVRAYARGSARYAGRRCISLSRRDLGAQVSHHAISTLDRRHQPLDGQTGCRASRAACSPN